MLKCCQVVKCLSFQIYSGIDSLSDWMAPTEAEKREKNGENPDRIIGIFLELENRINKSIIYIST